MVRYTEHPNSSTLARGSSQKAQAAEELLLSLLSQYCQGRGINLDLVEMSWSTCCSIPMQSSQPGKLLEAKKKAQLQCEASMQGRESGSIIAIEDEYYI